MSKQLDRLFKEKLENHQVAPSEAAWANVEASLGKEKKKGVIWFRAAAAIVLLGALTATLLWVGAGEEKTIAKVDSVRTAPKPKAGEAPKKKQYVQEPKLPVVRSQSRKTTVFIAQEENKKDETTPTVQQEQTVAIVSETRQAEIQQEKPEVIKTKSAITLTYTLAPIPSGKEAQAPEERNGLQKVVDVAMDAKHSDGAISELRTMKDDLFALNFKKNNKK